MNEPYNPLAKANLARSIEQVLLQGKLLPLRDVGDIRGAGIYVIYYSGELGAYAPIRCNDDAVDAIPIYVGKAIPKGGRKGGLTKDSGSGTALRDRLKQHAASVDEAENIEIDDFSIRYLVVEDIWIPLGENMLIETFKPVWNRAIDGFGNKDPGKRRKTQYKSPWDVIHPGRGFADKLAAGPIDADFLEQRAADYFAGRKMKPLPKKLKDQLEEEAEDALHAADEIEL